MHCMLLFLFFYSLEKATAIIAVEKVPDVTRRTYRSTVPLIEIVSCVCPVMPVNAPKEAYVVSSELSCIVAVTVPLVKLIHWTCALAPSEELAPLSIAVYVVPELSVTAPAVNIKPQSGPVPSANW